LAQACEYQGIADIRRYRLSLAIQKSDSEHDHSRDEGRRMRYATVTPSTIEHVLQALWGGVD